MGDWHLKQLIKKIVIENMMLMCILQNIIHKIPNFIYTFIFMPQLHALLINLKFLHHILFYY